VAVSPKVQRALSKYYGISSRLIENGIPLDLFKPFDKKESRERLGITWRGPLGIFVGRAENAKGFDIVQTIAKRRRDIKILCVTPSKVMNKDMIVVRSVKNTAMPLYYGAADFLIFPSRYESLSYTSMEALACDLPVVASKTGVFEDLNEQDVGVLANSFEWEEFSRGIDKVMSLDIHPRDVAVKRFSIERFRADYVALAKEMAKSQN
jgi:UDP-glucose:(heptosyl)LPS alpha-1,3-glucosyltransferase